MPILFAVVARSTSILAKYAGCAGNFLEVVEQVLAKITPENAKLTYSHGSYLFHYISEGRIIYLCITDDDFQRSRAFSFLTDIMKRFQMQYGDRGTTALPYAMNSEFSRVLAAQMRHHTAVTSPSVSTSRPDHITQVESQVDELKGIMVRNIDNIASRGERLELLVDKTDDLSANSVTFKKQSRNLARSMWWKNVKLTVIIVAVVLLLIYIIVTISCGGFAWKKCVH